LQNKNVEFIKSVFISVFLKEPLIFVYDVDTMQSISHVRMSAII